MESPVPINHTKKTRIFAFEIIGGPHDGLYLDVPVDPGEESPSIREVLTFEDRVFMLVPQGNVYLARDMGIADFSRHLEAAD